MALQEELEQQGNFLFKYRGTLPLILLGGSMAVFAYTQIYSLGYDNLISYEKYEIIALIVSLLGLIVRIYTVGYSPANTSGRNTDEQLADVVNQTGIYSMVRHPLYVGNFLMWLGPAMLVQNAWFIVAFIFIYWVYYERIMFAEEQFLRGKFGDIYLKWAAKTPAFILCLKKYVKPNISFSLKKVIKKEKNGLAAVFLIFYIFRLIKEYIYTKSFALDTWIFYAMLGSLVLYFILKFIKKYTAILEDGR